MRLAAIGAVLAASLLVASSAADAQEASVSGALGGGTIDGQAAGLASADLDLRVGDELAVGVGARLRLVDGELLDSDWDEPSDAGRLLRYLTWRREVGASASFSLAAGHLGGVTLGHGSLIRGYASGIDFDRGRAGAELRGRVGSGEAHLVIDDVVTAEILAARAVAPITAGESLRLGVSGVLDRPRDVFLASVDAELAGTVRWAELGLYVDLASRVGKGAGLHSGGRVGASRGETRVTVTGEARYTSRGYVPGWISPMYLRDRDQAGDAMDTPDIAELADRDDARGWSWLAAIDASTSLGTGSLSVATRPGLPWQVGGRLSVPVFRPVQAGAWVVYERGGDAALAGEVRARLPRSLFVRAELARQYTAQEMGLTPIWLATASLGAVLGE